MFISLYSSINARVHGVLTIRFTYKSRENQIILQKMQEVRGTESQLYYTAYSR